MSDATWTEVHRRWQVALEPRWTSPVRAYVEVQRGFFGTTAMQRFVDEDTWQLARFLLERRPTTAFEDAITRAQAARRRGDTLEFKAWVAIADAVQELERPARPSDQIH